MDSNSIEIYNKDGKKEGAREEKRGSRLVIYYQHKISMITPSNNLRTLQSLSWLP